MNLPPVLGIASLKVEIILLVVGSFHMTEDTVIPSTGNAPPVFHNRKMQIVYTLVLAISSGITAYVLSVFGYIMWDPISAFIVGCLTPIVIIEFKVLLRLPQHSTRLQWYAKMNLHFNDAMVLYNKGKWSESLLILDDLLGENKDHKRALYYGALCHKELQNNEAMIEYFTRYLELTPSDMEVADLLKSASSL
ncbi:MAG: tetratricopeptide repeat protein [Candidatus Thorarchaeota archaeon]